MKYKFYITIFISAFITTHLTSKGTDCKDIRTIIAISLKEHYSEYKFDHNLSTKILRNYIKYLDPAKIYFKHSEVENFIAKNATKLGNDIIKGKCSIIQSIYAKYSVKLKAYNKYYLQNLTKKHDYSKDEFFLLDRKTLPFAKDDQEIQKRWLRKIKYEFLQLEESEKQHTKIIAKLKKKEYLFYKRHQAETSSEVFQFFLQAFSTALGPHTLYLPPKNHEEFKIDTSLSLEGIGALLRSEDGITKIQEIIPGGAAHKDGKLKAGDKIVAVAQGHKAKVNIIDMDLSDVVRLIRGKRGTLVKLYIRRSGKDLIISLIREKINLKDKVAKSSIYKAKSGNLSYKIGVIDLPSFYLDFEGRRKNEKNYRSSSKDVQKELNKLKSLKVDAIIVDLRSNGGGSLDEAIEISGLFIGKNPVVQIKDKNSNPSIKSYGKEISYKGPLVGLINRSSASASEILVGATKDSDRMLLIGDSTFGKGTVQNLRPLPNNSALKVTVSKFYRPSGASTQLRGVHPHINLPSIADAYEIGEKYYDHALKWEQVKNASFKQFNMVNPYLKKLKTLSDERVSKNKEFGEIKKNIDEFLKNKQKHYQISLKRKPKSLPLKKTKTTTKKQKNKKTLLKEKTTKKEVTSKLNGDVYLKEALKITVNYLQLIKKNTPQPIAFGNSDQK